MKRKILDIFRLIWKIPILEKMLASWTFDKTTDQWITKFPPNCYQYSKNSIREVERNGVNYILDLSDMVDWHIYFGFKEIARQELLGMMNKGDTIIDIGANVGDVSLHAAKIIGDKGSVHSFEPDPINFQRLSKNWKNNHFSNIVLNNLGIGNEKGSFNLAIVREGNQGMNRIVASDASDINSNRIDVITLDSYVRENDLKKVDLIKIDVEGFEMNVLKGSKEVINAFRPSFFIELDDSNLREQGSSAKELVELLEGYDYQIRNAESKEQITPVSDFQNCHFDIIASQP